MSILYKVCSHPSLLQVKQHPDQTEDGTAQSLEAKRRYEQAVHFLPDHLPLPGRYIFQNGMMDDHFALSGKMKILDKLLAAIHRQQGRVLLFAHSTKSLDLIENYIKSVGYSFLRMDGQTPAAKRKEIADKFRASNETFVFLLSTKAMGQGLNLTQVSYL